MISFVRQAVAVALAGFVMWATFDEAASELRDNGTFVHVLPSMVAFTGAGLGACILIGMSGSDVRFERPRRWAKRLLIVFLIWSAIMICLSRTHNGILEAIVPDSFWSGYFRWLGGNLDGESAYDAVMSLVDAAVLTFSAGLVAAGEATIRHLRRIRRPVANTSTGCPSGKGA